MNLIFFDDKEREHLFPLTFTRPAAEMRCGILRLSQKWEKRLKPESTAYHTAEYLSSKYTCETAKDNLFINGRLLPNESIVAEILALKTGEWLYDKDVLLAGRVSEAQADNFTEDGETGTRKQKKSNCSLINRGYDIFRLNEQEIEQDFLLITKNRSSQKLSPSNRALQTDRIFLEEGAKVEFSILNPADGYIYIGKDAEIMENVSVHGSLALNDHAVLKMGAKIYGATTLGEYCKAGGEINNSVFFAYSNKAHDGFMGNAVIGEWCNIGADSNNSNLKNNYDQVKLWSYPKGGFERTGLQFCGLIMGDHSKCGINTMFNTGTVVGVSANIFGSGFPRNFIPSFSWGGAHGFTEHKLPKAFKTAEIMTARRDIPFDETEKNIMTHIFDMTQTYRNF